jgi:hypothetical protein
MNNLNSILIEGNLTGKPVQDGATVNFTIASTRYLKGKRGLEKQVSRFEVGTTGKLAEA